MGRKKKPRKGWLKFKNGFKGFFRTAAPVAGRLAGTAFQVWAEDKLLERRSETEHVVVDRRKKRRRGRR